MISCRARSRIIISACLTILSTQICFALSTQEAEQLIAREKIFDKGTTVTPNIAGDEAQVQVRLPEVEKVTSDKYKVNATLVAKAIIGADKAIKKVIVRFYNGTAAKDFKEVMVRELDIKAYGSGAITADDLLSNLELTDGSDSKERIEAPSTGSAAAAVDDGPLKPVRQQLYNRIQALKTRGIGVTPFIDRLNQLSEQAKTGKDADISDDLDSLSDSISDQEKALSQRARAEQQRSTPSTRATAPPVAAGEAPGRSGQSGGGGLIGTLVGNGGHSEALNTLIQSFKISAPRMARWIPDPNSPMFIERLAITRRLHEMGEHGADVRQWEKPFQVMEELARRGQIQLLKKQISDLNQSIDYEEKLHPSYRHHHHD